MSHSDRDIERQNAERQTTMNYYCPFCEFHYHMMTTHSGLCPRCGQCAGIEEWTTQRGGPTMITDTEARRISSEWHGGGGTALYALSSTGAINTARADHGIVTEIIDEIEATTSYEELNPMTDMHALLDYVQTVGPRGPVDGWSTLTW